MAEEALPPGFVLDEPLPSGFVEDGQMHDAISSPPQSDGSLRELAIALAKHIFAAAPDSGAKQVIGELASGVMAPVEFLKGAVSGLKRNDFNTDQPFPNQFGQAVGRYGIPVAAAMAAPALAPAAVAAGAPTALTALASGAIGAASQDALAAGLGDLAGMGASKALGGNAPASIGEAVSEASKTGLETAGASLGLSGAIGVIKSVIPRFLQSLQIVPAESLKRIIETDAKALRGGKLTQTGAELQAIRSLRAVQRAVENERNVLGREVDSALQEFQGSTKGQHVIDASGAASRARQVLSEASTGSAGLDDVLSGAEKTLVEKIARQIEQKPLKSAVEAVNLRRQLDDLTKFKSGGVGQVSSEVGQRAVREMGAALRESINTAAQANGATGLIKANANASRFYRGYDGIARDISTKGIDTGTMLAKVKQLAVRFNEGGVNQLRLEQLAQILPGAESPTANLLDYIAAREFLIGVKKTPSSGLTSMLRAVLPALGIARGLPLAKQAEAMTKVLTRAGVAGMASKVNQK